MYVKPNSNLGHTYFSSSMEYNSSRGGDTKTTK